MLSCFHTFVFAAYPVLVVVGANAGVVPIDWASAIRTLAVAIGAAAALLVLLKPVIPDRAARAACLSFALIGFHLFAVAGALSDRPIFALLYTMASCAAAVAIVRPWRARRRSSAPLNAAAGVMLAVNLYAAAPALRGDEAWRPLADALIENVARSAVAPPAGARPDIYHIVLDGFGRPDVLRDLYSLDLGPLVAALESRGFTVPRAGRSNYSQTYLSLASTLNLSYLDPVASVLRERGDRRALHYLIQHNALARLARRAGYRVLAVGSDYAATTTIAAADECRCEQYGLSELEGAVINLTPLRALPIDRWTFGAHRRKVEQSFLHLEALAAQAGPKLVFAHIVSPHPPFVFGADGGPAARTGRVFTFGDGDHYLGAREDYIDGYRSQTAFVAARVLSLVDAIVRTSARPPVIVVHGDHGPGSTWNWSDLRRADARERLAIFLAVHFPGAGPPSLEPDVSPVNVMRALANRYLGVALPGLPDASYASTWERPYSLVRSDPNAPAERLARGPAHEAGADR